MAQVLTKKEKMARQKAAMPADTAKALARVSGGLYVVTALNNSARGAMLASWVAQASFEPMGLTIAVAKDRAIESLMQVGFGCQVPGTTAARAASVSSGAWPACALHCTWFRESLGVDKVRAEWLNPRGLYSLCWARGQCLLGGHSLGDGGSMQHLWRWMPLLWTRFVLANPSCK